MDRDPQTVLLAIGLLAGVAFVGLILLGGLRLTVAHPASFQQGSWDLIRDREGRLAQVVARPLPSATPALFLPAHSYIG